MCTARMSMKTNCPRHSWLRHSQLICDQRPCFAGAEKWDSRRRQLLRAPITLNLSQLYNRGK